VRVSSPWVLICDLVFQAVARSNTSRPQVHPFAHPAIALHPSDSARERACAGTQSRNYCGLRLSGAVVRFGRRVGSLKQCRGAQSTSGRRIRRCSPRETAWPSGTLTTSIYPPPDIPVSRRKARPEYVQHALPQSMFGRRYEVPMMWHRVYAAEKVARNPRVSVSDELWIRLPQERGASASYIDLQVRSGLRSATDASFRGLQPRTGREERRIRRAREGRR
jgi:hypothetical protein